MVSGIVTLLVSEAGRIHGKDLGLKTVEAGRTMTCFNPDPGWITGQGK